MGRISAPFCAVSSVEMNSCSLPLPPELTLLVLNHLSIEDVLTIRQVSKTMCAITKKLILWMNLYHTCYSRLLVLPARLEEPLNSYSAEELEEIVVTRNRQIKLWNEPRKTRMRNRHKFCLPAMPASITLVPGGRWLLSITEDSRSVQYCDLNAATIQHRKLCEPMPLLQDDIAGLHTNVLGFSIPYNNTLEIERLCIDIVSDASSVSTLQFNLCTRLTLTGRRADITSVSILQIWKICLVGHGRDAELSARHLKTIVLPFCSSQLVFDAERNRDDADFLLDEYIIVPVAPRLGLSNFPKYHFNCLPFFIINWMESTPTHLCGALVNVKLFVPYATDVHLLPGNRLLFRNARFTVISKFPTLEHIPKQSLPTVANQQATLTSEFATDGSWCKHLPIIVERDRTRMLTCTVRGIFEIGIPDEGGVSGLTLSAVHPAPSCFSRSMTLRGFEASCVTPQGVIVQFPHRTDGPAFCCMFYASYELSGGSETESDSGITTPEWRWIDSSDIAPLSFRPDMRYDDDSGRLLITDFGDDGGVTIRLVEFSC